MTSREETMNEIIEEVKKEMKLGYVPVKPMELAIKKEKQRILGLINEIFSEGWFMYFQTTYGLDDMNVTDEMMEEIFKKIKELETKLEDEN